jgi:mannitol/fructose-specific phosphotransferase system IIA component (Ntr-type)
LFNYLFVDFIRLISNFSGYMILADNLNSSGILIYSETKTRWDIIKDMVHCASTSSFIPKEDEEKVHSALVAREKSMSTGIGKGVAIPHCTIPNIKNLIVLLATSQKGINFDSIDSLPVRIVIMLLVPKEKLEFHIKTLASIAKLMSDEIFKQGLLALTSSDAIVSYISNYESGKK